MFQASPADGAEGGNKLFASLRSTLWRKGWLGTEGLELAADQTLLRGTGNVRFMASAGDWDLR